MTRRAIPHVMIALLLLSSCNFLSKTKSNIYTLDVEPPGPEHVIPTLATPIALGSVQLPPGLDRRELVVRKADHQLDIRANDLWPSNLQPLVLHVLAFDLARRLPEGMVVLPGESVRPGTRTIDVVIEDFTADSEGTVTLEATWNGHRDGARMHMGFTDSAHVAKGMSDALALLAERISNNL